MRTLVLVLGMVLFVLGAQGVIRLVLLGDEGFFGWVPGGLGSQLVVGGLLVVVGIVLLKQAPEERAGG